MKQLRSTRKILLLFQR